MIGAANTRRERVTMSDKKVTCEKCNHVTPSSFNNDDLNIFGCIYCARTFTLKEVLQAARLAEAREIYEKYESIYPGWRNYGKYAVSRQLMEWLEIKHPELKES